MPLSCQNGIFRRISVQSAGSCQTLYGCEKGLLECESIFMQSERRKNHRYNIRGKAFAVMGSESVKMMPIIDISSVIYGRKDSGRKPARTYGTAISIPPFKLLF
jgi:hypothetical protein